MLISTGSLRAAIFPRSTALTHASFIVGGVLFTAALAQIAIVVPGSPVPVTGQTLAVYLIGTTYGARLGFATFATYLVAGIAGAPIFAPAAGLASYGWARITGATGGYLVGMLIAALILGALADRRADQKFKTSFPALILGSVIIFVFGLTWLHAALGISWSQTISFGLTPFIFGELIKIAITATSLPLIWRKISQKLAR
ncbi:MAG: biotin transporter BioY [Candidatus Planktophila sp.]|jgi:biotin transport system substrate-specific component|tara:strand:- start:3844 stop:4443 length:600 start_codon:yes stop_codon:yes gene_type:complete